jgi:hypothetical protein
MVCIRWWATALTFLLLTVSGQGDAPPATRNPFGLPDTPELDLDELNRFAKIIQLTGDHDDANAPMWVDDSTRPRAGSLDGEWGSRWHAGGGGTNWLYGKAAVRTVNDRVYILYTDSNCTNLVEAICDSRGRLLGRWIVVGNGNAGGRFFGQIVNQGRIDGMWSENNARWDFRRKVSDRVAVK